MSSAADQQRTARVDGVRVVVGMVALMWIVEAVDAVDHHGLDHDGIRPRSGAGLLGIIFAPFLHTSWGHLIANTVPFVILGLVIAWEGVARVAAVTLMVALVSGLGTWLIAPASSVTDGASGVVFGYATYVFARGVFNRNIGQLAIGVVVAAVFGAALLWSLLPHQGISWQAHLFGALGGVVAARLLADATRRRRLPAGSSST
jgi:membrane associated rhomboid family serine protease